MVFFSSVLTDLLKKDFDGLSGVTGSEMLHGGLKEFMPDDVDEKMLEEIIHEAEM